MNDRLPSSPKIERHLQLWIYFLPIVGIIPSLWTLYQSSQENGINLAENRKQKKASRQSLGLVILWLICYSSFSLGAINTSDILSFRLLYANTIITTAYFVICTVLMCRLSNQK